MAGEKRSTFRESLSVLRSGMLARFMIVDFISMVGSWMQTQALQLLVEEQARTSMEQALVSFALTLVIPLFNPLGGTMADRHDRRRILFIVIAAQGILAAAMGFLVFWQVWLIWHLAVFSIFLGITHAFEGPAFAAFLPQLVPREKLGAAVALDRSIFHGARMIGPALAGLVVYHYGTAYALFGNALSYVGPLLILMTIPRPPPVSVEEQRQRRTGFMDGWRFVRSDAPTLRMVLMMATSTLFCSPFIVVLLTFYAKRTLGLDSKHAALLMSLTGIGAVTASFAILAIPHHRRTFFLRLGATMSVGAMLALSVLSHFALAAVTCSVLTMGLNFIFGIGNQLVQERAPDALRGRVSAVAAMSFVAVIPFSGLFAALLDGWFGMRQALVICGCGFALSAAYILSRRWPETSPVLEQAAGKL
jgi:MFS family permease